PQGPDRARRTRHWGVRPSSPGPPLTSAHERGDLSAECGTGGREGPVSRAMVAALPLRDRTLERGPRLVRLQSRRPNPLRKPDIRPRVEPLRRPRLVAALALALGLLAPGRPAAHPRPLDPMDAGEMAHALHRLQTVGTALYVAAHPDDENTALLAW